MKKLFFRIFIFISTFSILNISYLSEKTIAQWSQMGGPYRGFISSVLSYGNYIFAGTFSGGIFRSTNNGINWTAVNNGINYTNSDINILFKNGNYLFTGTSTAGLYRSTDNGNNWQSANNGITSQNIQTIFFDSTKLYAGTGNGIYTSINNGNNWISSGLTSKQVNCFMKYGTNIYAGTDAFGIFQSGNSGQTWTAINNGLVNQDILSLATLDSNFYAGSEGGGMYRSTNYGSNWFWISGGTPYQNIIYSILSYQNDIYCATNWGIIKSTNKGTSWSAIAVEYSFNYIYSLILVDSNFIAGTSYGIYFSTNKGVNWSTSNNGITNEQVLCFTSCDSYLFAGSESGGVYRSSNGGVNWQINFLPSKSVYSLTTLGSYIFAGTVNNEGVYRSTNYGVNWTIATSGITNALIMRLVTKGNCIFAGTFNGVYRSTNLGDNWVGVNSTMQNYPIYALAVKDSFVYAGVNYAPGGIYLTSNNGDNWLSITNNLTSTNIRSILPDGNKLYVGTSGGVFVSSNNGGSWSSLGLPNFTTYCLSKYGTYLIAGTNSGVYLYDEAFKKWNSRNDGFCEQPWIYTFFKTDNYLLAGTLSQSVWRRSLVNIIGINKISEFIPENNSLRQNYPNPFNPTTTIRFDLIKNEFITLKIYDALGKELEQPVNEKHNAGSYEVIWDASKYPSGVYYYRLTAGNFSDTRKMILIK